MGEDREQSEVSDFGEILNGTPDDSPLLVGGHAVNVWALLYHRHIDAELKCQRLLPLTSKDLDLYGDGELLETVSFWSR